MPQWQVKLFVYGSITVKRDVRLNEPKGWNPEDMFYSDIHVRSNSSGATISLTARADTELLARKAALHYLSQALDVLALDTRQSMYLSSMAVSLYCQRGRIHFGLLKMTSGIRHLARPVSGLHSEFGLHLVGIAKASTQRIHLINFWRSGIRSKLLQATIIPEELQR